MTLRHFFSTFAIPIGIVLGLLWSWEQTRKRARGAVPIDVHDPVWIAAVERARATVPLMRELSAGPDCEMYVKYPLETDDGSLEHVWGRVLALTKDTMTVSLETPTVALLTAKPPFKLELIRLEDWQCTLPDGRIRGAFTTQAHITLARSRGVQVPPDFASQEDMFVDR